MGNLPNARIIHGKGTGVLRAAVQEELRRKQLKPHFLAPFQSGTPLRESLRAYVREQGEKLEKFRKR